MNCKICSHRVRTEGDGVCDHPKGFGADGECPLEMINEVHKALNTISKYCSEHNKCEGCVIQTECLTYFDSCICPDLWDKIEVNNDLP